MIEATHLLQKGKKLMVDIICERHANTADNVADTKDWQSHSSK